MTERATGALSRNEVEAILDEGTRWRVTYCPGARTADETGAGAPLPRGVLERVPTPAALRKKKPTSRFRFYANLTTDATGNLLLLQED